MPIHHHDSEGCWDRQLKAPFAILALLVLGGCGQEADKVPPRPTDFPRGVAIPASAEAPHPQSPMPVATIDLAELSVTDPTAPEASREAWRETWIESMQHLEGKVVRVIGCFSDVHSVIPDDPKSLSLFACAYLRYPDGSLIVLIDAPPRRLDIRFPGNLPSMSNSEEPQPFAVIGTLRLDDLKRRTKWSSWARLEALSYEPVHSIPVGPRQAIPAEMVVGIEELFFGSAWADFVSDEDGGGKGRKNVGGDRPHNEFLIVRHRDAADDELIVKIFRIRPGGYYLTRAEDILIVPDPTGRE